MRISIDEIFDLLSWNSSEEKQKKGVDLAGRIHNLSALIMPMESKATWENCAKVLVNKTDKELQVYYVALFEWLKDMNWPGAYLIFDRLMHIPDEYFLPAYQYSYRLAEQTQDCSWMMALEDLLNERNNKTD